MKRTAIGGRQPWADDELRSLNGQIQFVLRRVLQKEATKQGRPANAWPPAQAGAVSSAARGAQLNP